MFPVTVFFVIGVVCLIGGTLITHHHGASPLDYHYLENLHKSDYLGVSLVFGGLILMVGSVLAKLWHYI